MKEKELNWKLIVAIISLFVLSMFSFANWSNVSFFIMKLLESRYLTVGIWILILLIAIFHFYSHTNKNLISDKEGLDKPIDYVQFVFTYSAIASSIQALSREVFAHYNFKTLSKCKDFNGIENVSFIIVIIVLTFYSYGRIKPIVKDLIYNKKKIRIDTNDKD